ncbi:MAG TPA: helix-turn-helix domain-containing protein [Solirubrobacteraceae bacterium]|nr:helix-turn-helix domain-containing protein [Solirubrobacteraceae bacterium]
MVARAGVPASAFHEVFQSEEECLQAAFDEGVARLSEAVLEAARRKERWLDRVRAGLVALLGFLDDEPRWGRLLIVQAPLAGAAALERRQRMFGVLAALLSEGRVEAGGELVDTGLAGVKPADGELTPSPALTAELVVGGVFAVIHARVLDGNGGPLVELAPSLMSFVVAPYLGQVVAGAELSGRPAPTGEAPWRAVERAERPIRATYRTTLVLRAIASAPQSSNREVAQAAGLADEGQASRLLGRLERRGLVENVGLGQAYGEPNAWLLTPDGRRVAELSGYGLGLDAAPVVTASRKAREAA